VRVLHIVLSRYSPRSTTEQQSLITPTYAGFGASWDGTGREIGGASRDRTDDLFHAMEALSQLSYGPTRGAGNYAPPRVLSSLTGAGCEQKPPWTQDPRCACASAASSRARVRSRPSRASVASIGGETAVPVTATRTG
jgi:hypothetical protein